jgi:trimeric autotransporter adhesin
VGSNVKFKPGAGGTSGGGGGATTVVTDGVTILGVGSSADKVRAKTDAGGLALRTYADSVASAAQSAAQTYAASAAAAAAAASVPTSRTIQGASPIAIAGGYAAVDLSTNRVFTFSVASEARGDLFARGASTWDRLALGAAGRVLSSDGNDPTWATFASVYVFGSDARGDLGVRGASAYGRLAIGAAGRILGSDGTDPSWVTFASVYAFGSDAQGDLSYRNATTYTRLAAGTAGQALITGGASANPSWDYPTTVGKSATDTTYDGGVKLGASAEETVSTDVILSATKTWHNVDSSGGVRIEILPNAAAVGSIHTIDDSTGSFGTNKCTLQSETATSLRNGATLVSSVDLTTAGGTWAFKKMSATVWKLLGGSV